jgi:hypothetical protein
MSAMSRFRMLVLWCLAFAMPVQGYASAAMLICGPRHVEMAADAAHDHAGHAHPHSMDAAHDEGADGGDGALVKIAKIKCIACAACGALSAAAPAPVIPALGISPAGHIVIPFLASSYAGVVPAGLERPPRAFPA